MALSVTLSARRPVSSGSRSSTCLDRFVATVRNEGRLAVNAGRKALPAALAPDAIERILRHAPPSALESLLDRIEQELLPSRQ